MLKTERRHAQRSSIRARIGSGASPRKPLGGVSRWIDDEFLANGLFKVGCAVLTVAPRATPHLAWLTDKLTGNRDFTDFSTSVFTSARRVRFREMEYAIPLEAIPEAVREVRALIERKGWHITFPIEVRAAASDENWLSTAYGRETGYIAVHRYFREDPTEYFTAVEQIMRSFGGRPHWGKMHTQTAETLRDVYPRFDDFVRVRDELDPERRLANPYLDRVLDGGAGERMPPGAAYGAAGA